MLTAAIKAEAPGASVSYSTISQYVDELLITERLMASLSGFLGVLALAIATIGLYGVMAYLVSRRRKEIGLRIALGAAPRAVIGMMLAESGLLLVTGVVIGGVLAVFASHYAASLLYGISPLDPWSFAIGISALAAVGLLASWVPAHRAANMAPTSALRE